MNLVQRASSLLFPAFRFGFMDPLDAEKLVDLSVGGFCLYGGEKREVFELIQRLQKRARNPLLFCADYEDGPGAWVEGGTVFPSNMAIAASGSEGLAREKGRLTAIESRALGVDWVLAPVVDLATRPENPIVNLRAFGADPALVTRLAGSYLAGLKDGGALGSIKHFPGHGETSSDSHLELPDLDVPLATLMKRELRPFIALKDACGTVMVAHLRVTALDKALPASLSKLVLKDLLREKLGFKGLIVTDALSMNAISGKWPHEGQVLLALGAGAEVLLVPDDPFAFQRALLRQVHSDEALQQHVMAASERLVDVKKSLGLFDTRGLLDPKGLEKVGHADHQAAARRMAEAALTWACGGGVPLKGHPSIAYLEPENNPKDWEGVHFLDEIEKAGVRVMPYSPKMKKVDALVVSIFSRPQAYLGRIGLDRAQASAAKKAMAKAGKSVVVSFGTPFAVKSLPKAAALCAFSDMEASQRAAAGVLLERSEAKGILPVHLE